MSAQEQFPPVFNGHGSVVGRINTLGEYEPIQDNNPIPVGVDEAVGADAVAIYQRSFLALPDTPIIDQHAPGAKLDQEKVDMALLQDFMDALYEVARVGTYGKAKYTLGGWLQVPEGIRRYTAALFRHLRKEGRQKYDVGDPFYDTPAGLPFKNKIRHDAQVAWNALARLQLRLNEERARGEYGDE